MNIVLVALSVGIFLTYLRPTFAQIEVDQDSITLYREELTKVQSVNARLTQLATAADQLTTDDRKRLYTFLPNEVDAIAVQRDLYLIAQETGVALDGLSAGGVTSGQATAVAEDGESGLVDRSVLATNQFSLQFTASYELLKVFLAALEKNNYPLYVSSLTIGGGGSEIDEVETASLPGELSISMTLETYSLVMQESTY